MHNLMVNNNNNNNNNNNIVTHQGSMKVKTLLTLILL